LRSRAHYGLPPAEIAARLRLILLVRGLRLRNKQVCLRALDLWTAYPALDFEDVLLAHAERLGIRTITSCDTAFDRIPDIERQEP
jgi:predicted nucleic acid-binding protein